MPSILPDFEYDIFISYRQNDNKYDGWVAEFVNNLNNVYEAGHLVLRTDLIKESLNWFDHYLGQVK